MREVWLRRWRDEDAAAIAPILADPEVAKWSHIGEIGPERWIAGRPPPSSR